MTPEVGELYTVTPHLMHDGVMCGRWHCRINGPVLDTGRVFVQELVPDEGRWRRRMSTVVPVATLVPLEVQVDLFGDPAGAL